MFVVDVVSDNQLLGTVERSDLAELVKKYGDRDLSMMENRPVSIKYHPSVVTVQEDTSLQQLHMFFITNRLRFAFVTRRGVPVGLITRESLVIVLKKQKTLI